LPGARRSRSVARRVERRGDVGAFRSAGRTLATLLLAGLTTAEVLAVAMGTVAFMALLWATDTVDPERLITGAGFRAAWIILVVAMIRPVTWLPYVLPFLAFRQLFDMAMPGRRETLRNVLAHLVTIGVLVGVIWLIAVTVRGAVTSILSGLAFGTGSGSFETLGTFRGDWTRARIALLVGAVVLVRVVLPPMGRDGDLSHEPVLGFARGARGTFDRYILMAVGVASLGIGLIAYVIGRS
jgi:hypothetical protein